MTDTDLPGVAMADLDTFTEAAVDAHAKGGGDVAATFSKGAAAIAEQFYDGAYQGTPGTIEREQIHSFDGMRRFIADNGGAVGRAFLQRYGAGVDEEVSYALAALNAYPETHADYRALSIEEQIEYLPRLAEYARRENLQPFFPEAPAGIHTLESARAERDELMAKHIGTPEYSTPRIQNRIRQLTIAIDGDRPLVGRLFRNV